VSKADLLAILRSLQSTRFRDLAGSHVAATIPVSERLINEMVAATLPPRVSVREVHVHPEAGNRFAVRVAPRAALLPSLTIALAIERQPDFPSSPVLVLRMATMGGLFGMATSAFNVGQMLPPGVRLEGEHIHLDLRALAAERGAAHVLDYVKQLRVTTEEGRAVLHLEGAV
jgi:hypothetical protein